MPGLIVIICEKLVLDVVIAAFSLFSATVNVKADFDFPTDLFSSLINKDAGVEAPLFDTIISAEISFIRRSRIVPSSDLTPRASMKTFLRIGAGFSSRSS